MSESNSQHNLSVKIKVKNTRGIVRSISPHDFRKKFGVQFTSCLLIDKNCPPGARASRPLLNPGSVLSQNSNANPLYSDQIRQAVTANIYIGKVSDQVGFGVFAAEEIQPGQMIGEYTGLARLKKESDCSNAYIFNYVHNAIIDASKRGNSMRFVNHSSRNPNASYKRVFVDGVEHVIFLAERQIAVDEQILFDYGEDYWTSREAPQEL